MINFNLGMTLEQLENDYWEEMSDYPTRLIETCYRLRKKPLKDFVVEDLRVMIGQNIGLKYLVPIAIDVLKDDPFVEGGFHEGDLLKSLLACDKEYWKKETGQKEVLLKLFEDNIDKLRQMYLSEDIKRELIGLFNEMQKLHS